jgi:nitrite reductase/ring-hydroxylating ferredoxin subunit
MPDTGDALPVCRSSALAEGGIGHVFDLLEYGLPARAFVVRFEGRAVGYLNRCAHVPAELDWQPGKFFDDTGRWLVCSIHGAVYDPAHGDCVAGPCVRKRLKPIAVAEWDGQVYWYPSQHLQPAAPTP